MEEIKTEVNLEERIAELEAQNKNLKATLSERNSEAANRRKEAESWKEKYEATLGEQEQAELRRKEAEEQRDREFAELKRDNSINKFKAVYLGMGYPEALAQAQAEARADGNDEAMLKNESEFAKLVMENTKTEMLKNQPTIASGKPMSAEDVAKKDQNEMMKWATM